MTWQHHFNRSRESVLPVAVDKQQVGPIPPGFEAQGLTINGLWGVYERQQGVETIKITELPAQYRVSVSNMVGGNNQLQQPRTNQLQQPTTTSTIATTTSPAKTSTTTTTEKGILVPGFGLPVAIIARLAAGLLLWRRQLE